MSLLLIAICAILIILIVFIIAKRFKRQTYRIREGVRLRNIEKLTTPFFDTFLTIRSSDFNNVRERDSTLKHDPIIEVSMSYYELLTDLINSDDKTSEDYIAVRNSVLDTVASFPYLYQFPLLYEQYERLEDERLNYLLNAYVEDIGVRVDNDPYTDSENVHDVLVNSQVKKISKEIEQTTTRNVNKLEIVSAIDKYLTGKENENAKKVLDTMISRNAYIVTLDKHEIDIINDVWNRQSVSGNNPTELQRSFVLALKDSVENGNVTCATGCTTRLIDSLTFIDKDQKTPLVTLPIIRQEIFTECGKLMTKYEDENVLKQKINELITSYEKKYPNYDFVKIREECLSL